MYAIHWRTRAFNGMNYLVEQNPELLDGFRSALQTLSEVLKTHPRTFGESRDGGKRVCFIEPIAVSYRVQESLKKVYILGVSLWSRP